MYHFHPIDEPEVSVDVSGLFDSPASQQRAASEALSSPSSSAAEAAVPQTPDPPASLRRPVPIAAATAKAKPDPTSRATSPSVVSSDDEGDGDDEDDDGVHGIAYESWVSRWGDDRDDERLPFGEECRPSATCWSGKRSVSDLSAEGSEGGAEGPDGDDDQDDDNEASQNPPRKKPKAVQQDDAQRRARILLWRQSLKRSLFQLQP
jgi:hypothetical protein